MQAEAETEISPFYGSDLVPYPIDELRVLAMEPTTATFLHACGLPALLTDGSELVITTSKHLSLLPQEDGRSPLYLFGTSEFCLWTIEQQSGWIYVVDDDSVAHFINSHIAALIVFCILYRNIHVSQPYTRESDSIYKKRATELRKAFRQYDARAVTHSMLWTTKIEEVRNGVV